MGVGGSLRGALRAEAGRAWTGRDRASSHPCKVGAAANPWRRVPLPHRGTPFDELPDGSGPSRGPGEPVPGPPRRELPATQEPPRRHGAPRRLVWVSPRGVEEPSGQNGLPIRTARRPAQRSTPSPRSSRTGFRRNPMRLEALSAVSAGWVMLISDRGGRCEGGVGVGETRTTLAGERRRAAGPPCCSKANGRARSQPHVRLTSPP